MIRTFAIAAAFALFGTAAQAEDGQFFDVAIDGYCTQLFLHVQEELVAGFRDNSTCATGSPAFVPEGGVVGTVDHQTGVIVSETDDNGKVYTWLFEQPVDGTGNVYVVVSDTKSSRRSASGTYHILHKKPVNGVKLNGPDFMDQVRAMDQVRQ